MLSTANNLTDLTHVHVIVRMNRLLTAELSAHYFNGTVAYNLNET